MLRRLSANKDEFIPIDFTAGINLIVAERAPDATDTDSRNARGKTSLLLAINYCLGGNRPTEFRPLGDADWEFTLALDLFGDVVEATRSLRGGSRIFLRTSTGAADATLNGFWREDRSVSLDDWKFLLGLGLFSLDVPAEQNAQGISARTLLSYVIRTEATKDPTKIFAAQPAWSSRQHIAFLLGLDWRYTQDLQRMKKDEETFEALQYAGEVNLVPGLMNDEMELMIQHGDLERELLEARRQADSFIVLDDPQGTLQESNAVAAELTTLTDEQVVANRLLSLYRESIADDSTDSGSDAGVGEIYRELGLVFSDAALRRFDQVEAFHQNLAGNRRRFLAAEIARLETEVRERAPRIEALEARRQGLLRQLSSGGAIEDLLGLQQRIADTQARLSMLDEAIATVRNVSSEREALRLRQATSRRDAHTDLDRNRKFLDQVNSRFSQLIRELYNRAASITVGIDDLGYKLTVRVQGQSSTGITKMQLMTFDLTLMELSRRDRHPHFLIHDSTVYGDVDPRQVATALEQARQTASVDGNQYIAMLNTNDVPADVAADEWYPRAVRRTILDTDVGGAFGVEF